MSIFHTAPLRRLAFVLPVLVSGQVLGLPSAFAQQGPLPVSVASPITQTVTDYDEYTGRFEAVERVELRARVSGFLESVHFTEGDRVEKDQLLFVIDPRPFQAELAAAEAQVAGARTQLDIAEREYKRGLDLVKRSAMSREQADQRRAARESAATEVQVAEANMRIAELNLAFTEVRAPIAGRISDARVDVGNLVAGGTGATLLTTIVSTDPIFFTFSASEADFLKYARLEGGGISDIAVDGKGPAVSLRLMDEDGWPHRGRMAFVDNELSTETASIRGKALFDNTEEFLKPGVFGRLRLAATKPYDALMIPDAAVIADQNRKIVMVVDGEGTVSVRPVVLGPIHEGLRVVRSGLSADDTVIMRGLLRARPGGKVVPVPHMLKPGGALEPLSPPQAPAEAAPAASGS
ncbi:MAG: efflux RND transporter periplasmic adaptor subunit [Rhodospirillales bacterium]